MSHVCPAGGSLLGMELLVFSASIFLLTGEKGSVFSLNVRKDVKD